MPASSQIIGRIAVKVLPDTSEFRREAKTKLDAIERQLNFKVKIELDHTGLRESLDRIKRELEGWKDQHDPLKIHVDVVMTPGQTTTIAARLAYLTRPRHVLITPQMNEAALAKVGTALAALSGARVLKDLLERIKDIAKDFDRLVPKIGAVGMAIGGLSSWILAGISNISAFTYSIGQMFTALLAAPGAFAGMAVGLGVSLVALTQMKSVVPDILDSFKGLADTIGKNFWAEAGAGIGDLLKLHLEPLGQTARETGKFFGAMAAQLAGPFKDAIPAMFASLHESIRISTGSAGVFASVITSLGLTGAEYLPQLSSWFSDIMTTFDNFLKRARGDGSLQKWIDDGVTAIKDMFRMFLNLGKVIADIGRAAKAAGGSTFGVIADTLERVHAITSSPEFQNTLVAVFTTAHEVMSRISDAAGPALVTLFETLADTFTRIGPVIGDGIGIAIGAIADALSDPSLQAGIQTVFVAMKDAIIALAPALPPIAQAIGSLAPLFSALLGVIAPLVTAALVPLGEIIQILVPAIIPLIEVLGDGLLAVLEAVAPSLVQLAQVFADLVIEIMPLVEIIIAVLVPALEFLLKIVIGVFETILSAVMNAIEAIKKIFQGFKLLLSGDISKMWEGIKMIFSGALQWIFNIFNAVFGSLIASIKGWINSAKAFFAGCWDDIKRTLGIAWDIIKSVLSSTWNWLKDKLLAFVTFLREAPTKAMDFLKRAFPAAWEFIRGALSRLWEALKLGFSVFLGRLVGIPPEHLGRLKILFSTAWSAIKDKAIEAFGKLKTAIKDKVAEIVDWVKDLPNKVKSALGDLGGVLISAGKSLISGLLNGITSKFQEVKNKLKELTSFLPDWKGPADKDRMLLFDAGQLIIGGFIKGLESQYGAVKRSLEGLSGDVAGIAFAGPTAGNVGSLVGGAAVGSGAGRVLNYYAAPGSSLGSEEDLFAAAGRARMVGW